MTVKEVLRRFGAPDMNIVEWPIGARGDPCGK
jgi:hypothetical protein